MEVMRDSIIYFRNSPSILFWEAGNTVSPLTTCARWWLCASSRTLTAGVSWALGAMTTQQPIPPSRLLRNTSA